ncbi:MAG: IPT/TIG domain-containing protein, partial [Candidatus Binatia bacterium]
HVALGAEDSREVALTNSGASDTVVRTIAFRTTSGSDDDFRVEIGGQTVSGTDGPGPHAVALTVAAGAEVLIPVTFAPEASLTNSVDLIFETDLATHEVGLLATGGEGPDDPFLHVVIDAPQVVVDHDGDGSATVALRGGESHTHEPGRNLDAHVWSVDGAIVAMSVSASVDLGIGEHEISLSIFDDAEPAKTLSDTMTVKVVAADAVPGVLALYHDAGNGGDPLALIDTVPATADHGEILATTTVDAADGTIGSSPFGPDRGVLLRMLGTFAVPADGIYEIVASGGDHRLFVNGARVIGPMALAARAHTFEARFALDEAVDLPASIFFGPLGGTLAPIDADTLTHDESRLVPVINSMTTGGAEAGGQPVLITGIGFFPAASVSVTWGDQTLLPPAITVTPTTISLTSPPGVGTMNVVVSTPAGTSNQVNFQYDDSGPPPILFATTQLDSLADPTQAAWGPDGRLYVASTQGTITAYTFDDDYQIVGTAVIDVLVGTETSDILGLAFDPLAAPGQVAVYVSHTRIFAKGGACNFSGSFDYIGRISRITGPDFDTVEPVVTGLPTSNHDHAVNGLAFDSDGNLLVAVGGNTNAGIEACAFGAVPESPLSGAILEVELARPGFDGAIVHVDRDNGLPLPDQLAGDRAELAHGTDIRVRAPGFRNSFDLVFTTAGRVYSTDNGPDFNLGPASTGAQTQGPDPADIDSLGLAVEDGYHGHPNRNRGRMDPRQNVYRGTTDTTAPGELETPVATFQSSVDGIDE